MTEEIKKNVHKGEKTTTRQQHSFIALEFSQDKSQLKTL